ncbi:hypothetical protein TNCT_730691 [Trichonephila clavata]|uniref:Uncharacterized protein n=1 Tax=Trichonephila clavata TaxID=2740835 RepID=A0A8X6KFS7_TRICU|nr:hypothetical protein TNCT_730691 [Trichonephila clavata]
MSWVMCGGCLQLAIRARSRRAILRIESREPENNRFDNSDGINRERALDEGTQSPHIIRKLIVEERSTECVTIFCSIILLLSGLSFLKQISS